MCRPLTYCCQNMLTTQQTHIKGIHVVTVQSNFSTREYAYRTRRRSATRHSPTQDETRSSNKSIPSTTAITTTTPVLQQSKVLGIKFTHLTRKGCFNPLCYQGGTC